MRSTAWRIAVPLLVVTAACGRGPDRSDAMNAALQRDLAAASASGVELANGTKGYRPAQVVSSIEQSERSIPIERRPVRKPVVRNHAAAEGETEKAPDPAPDVAVNAPQPEPQQPEPAASDAPSVPMVAPRPAPLPVEVPAAEGGTRGAQNDGAGTRGTDLGTLIGVIIRGGMVGDDHCAPPRRPRSRPQGNGFPIFNPTVMPPINGRNPVLRTRGRF
jgi:hypothetical protein